MADQGGQAANGATPIVTGNVELVRRTVYIPVQLDAQLGMLAAEQQTSREQYIVSAVERQVEEATA